MIGSSNRTIFPNYLMFGLSNGTLISYLMFGSSDGTRFNGTGFIEPGEDLRDTTM